jgi:hypothetical protein
LAKVLITHRLRRRMSDVVAIILVALEKAGLTLRIRGSNFSEATFMRTV